MNSDANDTLKVAIVQLDGERVLSEMTIRWPELPNAEANRMNLALTEAIRAEVARWASMKAEVAG